MTACYNLYYNTKMFSKPNGQEEIENKGMPKEYINPKELWFFGNIPATPNL